MTAFVLEEQVLAPVEGVRVGDQRQPEESLQLLPFVVFV